MVDDLALGMSHHLLQLLERFLLGSISIFGKGVIDYVLMVTHCCHLEPIKRLRFLINDNTLVVLIESSLISYVMCEVTATKLN